jgi:excisionase family DNA binding protein
VETPVITPTITSPVLTVDQAAAYLQVGRRQVYRLVRARKIVFRKIDDRGTIRIHRDDLDAYVRGTK